MPKLTDVMQCQCQEVRVEVTVTDRTTIALANDPLAPEETMRTGTPEYRTNNTPTTLQTSIVSNFHKPGYHIALLWKWIVADGNHAPCADNRNTARASGSKIH